MSRPDSFAIEPPRFDPELEAAFDVWLVQDGRSLEEVAAEGIDEDEAGSLGERAGEAHVLGAWRALAADPENGLRMLDLASAHVDSIDAPETAERIFEEIDRVGRPGLTAGVLEEDPLFYLGWLYYLGGRDEEAVEAYRQTIERLGEPDPGVERDAEGYALVRYHLAAVYHELELWDEAVAEYLRSIEELDEDSEERGIVERELGNAREHRPFTGDIGPAIALDDVE